MLYFMPMTFLLDYLEKCRFLTNKWVLTKLITNMADDIIKKLKIFLADYVGIKLF